MLCAKFGWNWFSGFEDDFVNVFSPFHYYLPFEKGGALHLKKNLIPFTQKCFMQSLVESGSMVLMKIIFLILSMYFRYYLPLEKCEALCLIKLESPLPEDVLCQVLLKFAQWFWRRV